MEIIDNQLSSHCLGPPFPNQSIVDLQRSSSSIGKPDTMMDVQGASVSFGSKEKTSKKNTIQVSQNIGLSYI